jgi:hypothetical protein
MSRTVRFFFNMYTGWQLFGVSITYSFHTKYEYSDFQEVDGAPFYTKTLKFRVNVVSKSSSLSINRS